VSPTISFTLEQPVYTALINETGINSQRSENPEKSEASRAL